ncbi:hypothetical protein [Vibrio salinus]|uniref:hypothetical protein n=1 Tax=Vibrio salinus TaxID=2899784 RepID=UPI001E33AEA8|nr:hypothetical protein [Vibrio salinus]MCE0495454.1 hypothetical protein [Vibrio salinus]
MTVWVGFPFDEHTSLNPSDADKTRTFNKLNATSQQFIQSYQFSDVRYFELVPDSDYRNNYIDLIYKKYPFLKGRSLTILSPTRNTKNENVVSELVFLTLFIAFGAMCIFVLVELQGLNLTKVEEYIDSPELGKSLR